MTPASHDPACTFRKAARYDPNCARCCTLAHATTRYAKMKANTN